MPRVFRPKTPSSLILRSAWKRATAASTNLSYRGCGRFRYGFPAGVDDDAERLAEADDLGAAVAPLVVALLALLLLPYRDLELRGRLGAELPVLLLLVVGLESLDGRDDELVVAEVVVLEVGLGRLRAPQVGELLRDLLHLLARVPLLQVDLELGRLAEVQVVRPPCALFGYVTVTIHPASRPRGRRVPAGSSPSHLPVLEPAAAPPRIRRSVVSALVRREAGWVCGIPLARLGQLEELALRRLPVGFEQRLGLR